MGSWNTIAMWRPRISRSSSSVNESTSLPWNQILPVTVASAAGSSRVREGAAGEEDGVGDFPLLEARDLIVNARELGGVGGRGHQREHRRKTERDHLGDLEREVSMGVEGRAGVRARRDLHS